MTAPDDTSQASTDYVCRLPAETVERCGDWTECAAFRFVQVDDRVVHIEFATADDLERLTAPEAT